MELYAKAERLIPGGTQLISRRPSRFAYGVSPAFAQRAKGARFHDVDGNEYIDWVSGIGAIILGYADPVVDEAVIRQIHDGTMYSVNHELELELAELLIDRIPCAEMVRYAKGGGDACAIAVRIARGTTGRDTVLFSGYHGWHDWYLAANLDAESSLSTHLFPGIEPIGVPRALAGTACPFPYGDLDALGQLLDEHQGQVAAVMLEPMRSEDPPEGYLAGVKKLAEAHQVVLIFDEVSTGFRASSAGVQPVVGVTPDMAVYAKSISNGYPMGAVVGRRAVMEPAARMFISSTYWSDTIGLRAALTTLTEIEKRNVPAQLAELGRALKTSLNELAAECGTPVRCAGIDTHPHLHFDAADDETRTKLATLYIQEMAKRGCHGYPSFYLNAAQGPAELEQTIDAARATFTLLTEALDADRLDAMLECELRQDANSARSSKTPSSEPGTVRRTDMLNAMSPIVVGLLRTTLAVSVAFGLGWLFLKLFRARSARTHRFVWGAVLLQGWVFWHLSLPLLPAGKTFIDEPAAKPVRSHVDAAASEPTLFADAGNPVLYDASNETTPTDCTVDSSSANAPASSSPVSPAFPEWSVALFAGIWGGGLILILVRFSLRYIIFVREVSLAEAAPRPWSLEWSALLEEFGVRSDIPLLLHSAGPLLCRVPGGYRLLVPAGLWDDLSSSRRRAVLLHELTHYRRGDVWKSLLARLLLLPHWFNPFAWLAVRRFDEAAEWACDDAVCREHSELVTDYARTLLDLSVGTSSPAAYSPGAGGHCLADRIRRLFNSDRKEDFLMKRISLFTLVTAFSLLGLIRVGTAESKTESVRTTAPEDVPSVAATDKKPVDVPVDKPAAGAVNPTLRKYKIDEAVINLQYIFKHLPSFQKRKEQVKQAAIQAQKSTEKVVAEIHAAKKQVEQGKLTGVQLQALHRRLDEAQRSRRTRLLQLEAKMYAVTYAEIQAEVARYAREKDIRLVKRAKSAIQTKPQPADPRAILQKINQEVVYQADDRVDITKDILKRLIDAEKRNAAKANNTDLFSN
eukprot:g12513.t1